MEYLTFTPDDSDIPLDGITGYRPPGFQESRSQSNTDVNSSLNAEAIDFMTKDMRLLVKKIQDLHHLGIEDSNIVLPKICVVGDQSTGKSSLIEGMSEIKVPRSAGTCTRCPMEINLSESDGPWQCVVTLTKNYTFSTKQSFRKATKAKPLGPWNLDNEAQEIPFMKLFSKDQVQDAIKRAQLATLNPQENHEYYLPEISPNADNFTALVKFSPNVVRLDITAPNFPTLSFYDLPGVISQAETDDEAYLVPLVENLVKHYVQQDNCIILLTLPMTDDATNSSAARIVREIKATHRTLGVLTKPDRVEDIEQWKDLLAGEKFRLGHGYYVVRNNADPTVEHQKARFEEDLFFQHGQWSETLAEFSSQLGTRNLQNALSQLLLHQIKECLPGVTAKLIEKASNIEEQLSHLPEPVNQNTLYILCSKLQELKSAICTCLEGGSRDKFPMLKIWNRVAEDFASALHHTRPMVNLLAEHETYKSDDDCHGVESRQTPKKSRPSSEQFEENDESTKTMPAVAPVQKYHTEHFQQFQEPMKTFDFQEIRGYNEDWSSGDLNDQVHPQAIAMMNKLSISHWNVPMKIFLESTYKNLRSTILQQVHKVLSEYYDTELYRQVIAIARAYLDQLKDQMSKQACQIYDLEMKNPVARDRSTMQEVGDFCYKDLKKSRKERKVITLLKKQGQEFPRDRSKAEKLIASLNLGPDHYETEIKMIATTLAYYKVASSRFVDVLCMNIQHVLFSQCKENIYNEIEAKLGIKEKDALTRCAQLLADDPDRQRRREFLVREREKVATAIEWLSTAGKYGVIEEDDEMNVDRKFTLDVYEDNKMHALA